MKIDPLPILKEIHSAIDTELKTVKRYGATSRITLLSGIKSSKKFPRISLYRFEMVIQRIFPDGSQGKLITRGRSCDARVAMRESTDYELSILSERKPGMLDEIVIERAKMLEKETAELKTQADKLAHEIAELTGEEPSRIR